MVNYNGKTTGNGFALNNTTDPVQRLQRLKEREAELTHQIQELTDKKWIIMCEMYEAQKEIERRLLEEEANAKRH